MALGLVFCMNTRLNNLRKQFPARGIDAFLCMSDDNIRYLTGFPASESWLLVTKSKAYYITDFRYIGEAKKGMAGIAIHDHNGRMLQSAFELAKLDRCVNIGFDEQALSLALFKGLKKSVLERQRLIAANGLAESLRLSKDAGEIRQVRQALAIHKKALRYLKKALRPGMTERQAYLKLYNFVQEHKAGFSFPPIIAGGPNSSYPHAKITDRRVQKNDIVMVDFGVDVNGYKSDLTRMFYFGRIAKLIEDVSTYVAAAQRLAIEKIADGVPAREVDAAARGFLAAKNLDRYFGHALGHGVGLQIHEAPRLSQKSKETFRQGMIITVEPAVYLPGKFGVRLEEMVLVTKKGCEVLSDNID